MRHLLDFLFFVTLVLRVRCDGRRFVDLFKERVIKVVNILGKSLRQKFHGLPDLLLFFKCTLRLVVSWIIVDEVFVLHVLRDCQSCVFLPVSIHFVGLILSQSFEDAELFGAYIAVWLFLRGPVEGKSIAAGFRAEVNLAIAKGRLLVLLVAVV